VHVIGVDCATKDAKLGLARGRIVGGRVQLERAMVCGGDEPAASRIARWVVALSGPVLIAIDAPLGWPGPLSAALCQHSAGEEITVPPNEMFRRQTDRMIQQRLGKTPLDVGADRIARTAHAALRLLGEIRRQLRMPIPLAWSPEGGDRVRAIEVYPAATLLVHGVRSSGYKTGADLAARREIISGLERHMDLPIDVPTLEEQPDALDASVCLLAGHDFLAGRAIAPDEIERARKEGWIWVAAKR
jgi:hypothetical protein